MCIVVQGLFWIIGLGIAVFVLGGLFQLGWSTLHKRALRGQKQQPPQQPQQKQTTDEDDDIKSHLE